LGVLGLEVGILVVGRSVGFGVTGIGFFGQQVPSTVARKIP
jgi:hypothetical protein